MNTGTMATEIATRDAQAREQALDCARSFVVQAPAGSGKTELLTQRVLALLGTVEAPEQIVAMTFTRKAAAEMRRRILGELLSDRRPEDCTAAHEQRTRALAMAAKARDAALGWKLTTATSRLRITTIDGFCGLLVRRAPWLSAAGGMPELLDDARTLHAEAARRTVARRDADDALGTSLRRVLDHIDGNATRLADLLAQLIGRRDAWRGLLSEDTASMRGALEDALRALCEATLERARTSLQPEHMQTWWRSACAAARALPDDTALQQAVALGHLPESADECGHWPRLCALLLRQDGGLRLTVNKRDGFPTTDREALETHKALLQELAATAGVEPVLQALSALVAPRYEESQWRTLDDLLTVFRHALAELSLCFSEHGAADHTEITLRALDALGDPHQPSPLLLRMDHRIRHLLVDEFQDTSDVQMRLLERLTAGWEPGDGRTLFLVGDPMQSIYRFRNANVGLFLRARDRGVGPLPLERLRLARNFRSQAGIVDWVNATFPQVFGTEDIQRGAVAYEPSASTKAALPAEAVLWHLCDAQQEALQIAELCSSIADGESIAILVRSRSHLRHILPALHAAGIRPQAVDIDALNERPAVLDLMSLARALNHPGDRVAWLSVLRAPWCGLPLPALQTLCSGLDRHAPLWLALEDEAHRQMLPAAELARLERVLPALRAAMRHRGRRSLPALVEHCWRALGGPACLDSPEALDQVQATIDAVAEAADGAALLDPAALQHALDGLFAASGTDPRVQIMTMHKAKGLQFDHVLLPGLHRKPRGNDRPALVQSSLLLDGHERPLLAPLPRRDGDDDPLFALLHRGVEGERDRAESDRLLYVAATRAIRQLHLFAQVERKADGELRLGSGLLARLWPAVEATVTQQLAEAAPEAPVSSPPADAAATPAPLPLRRLPADWQPPDTPEGLPRPAAPHITPETLLPFDWAGERARVTGTLYHLCVEYIAAGDGVKGWDAERIDRQRDWLLQRARAGGLGDKDAGLVVDRVLQALHRTLDDTDGRWLLQAGHEASACELAMDTMVDGHFRRLRIDRSFVDADGTRWIIDYKTGAHEGGDLDRFVAEEIERYRAQLQSYAALFADEGRPVKLALYLPLLPEGKRLVEVGMPPATSCQHSD